VSTLFLAFLTDFESSTRLLWPDPDLDPGRTEPAMLEAEMDFWEGDEVLDLAYPWMLITADALRSVREAGLTGLHAVPLPTLRYSEAGAVRARLGDFAARDLPAFCVARTEQGVRVANQDDEETEWSRGDDLRYWDWRGDDFTRCELGLVVTERARSLLMARNVCNTEFHPIRPR
jgi:hypothetical protein